METRTSVTIKSWIMFLIIILLLFLLFFFYQSIIKPSILSVKTACGEITDEELNESGYFVAGEYNPSTKNITIYFNSSSVNRHENCHFVQDIKGRNYNNCDQNFGKFLNEIECKISEYLPGRLYNWIY